MIHCYGHSTAKPQPDFEEAVCIYPLHVSKFYIKISYEKKDDSEDLVCVSDFLQSSVSVEQGNILSQTIFAV